MANNNKNIEDLFKNNFSDYSVTPSSNVWNKISKKIAFNKFTTFNATQFNVYYVLLIVLVTPLIIFNLPKITNNKNAVSITTHKNLIVENNENITVETIIKNIEENTKKEIIKNDYLLKNTKKEEGKKLTQNNDVIINENITDRHTKENVDVEEEKTLKLAKPFASFSASTYEACEPATVLFTNTSENSKRYLWNFGNGLTSTEANPTFVYKTAGKYTVKLTVYSGSNFETISKEIIINPKPISDFIISEKNNIFKDDQVKFANLSTNFTSCKWSFGDDNTSNFTHPSHIFNDAGIYNISLICFSDKKCSDTSIFNNLQIKDEKYKIYAPTALSPNINGASSGHARSSSQSSSVFIPKFNYEPAEYYLRIFNKFGSIVFESKDVNFGWNGYYNNKPVPVDVYIWECSGKFPDGEAYVKTGNITILYLK